MEDKQLICNMLVPVLQHTRAYKHIKALVYRCSTNMNEYVDVYTFESGIVQITINVSMDSGAAMIDDIMSYLRRYYL